MSQPHRYKASVEDLSISASGAIQKHAEKSPPHHSTSTQAAHTQSPVHASPSPKNTDISDGSASGVAPVKTRRDVYVVQKGDTLYSVSERLDLNYRDIAELNKLGKYPRIQPGQSLLLPIHKSEVSQFDNSLNRNKNQTKEYQDKSTSTSTPVLPLTEVTKTGGSAKQATKLPESEDLQEKPELATVTDEKQNASRVSTAQSASWIWPTEGKIISSYQEGKNKGIDISGKLDQPILAVNAGKVIYVGSGLTDYGKLIIVDHGNQMMSAYAHNSKILVAEGDQVEKGQSIAKMGKTESGAIQLYFEIRKDGNPVNPLNYLPKSPF